MIFSNSKTPITISFVLVLFCIQPVKLERWQDNVLYDLEGNGQGFVTQTNLWTASALINSNVKVFECAGTPILGGYNILAGIGPYFERTFTGLPAHNQINCSIDIYPIDSWDGDNGNDHFSINIGDQTMISLSLNSFVGYSTDRCGNSIYKELDKLTINIVVPHNSTSVNMRVTTLLDEPSENESLGFRDISLTFDIVNNPEFAFCTRASFPLSSDWCKCQSSQYFDSSSGLNCYNCDPTCTTCNGGGPKKCLTCPTGNYLVSNNSCIPDCPEPFYSTSNGVKNFCETPCPGQFAYKNNRCDASCFAPLQSLILSDLKGCVCYSTDVAQSNTCYSCDISCASCNGTAADECLNCFSGFYLQKLPGLEIGTCEPCNSSCLTCYGPAVNQCLSCFPGKFLVSNSTFNNGTCAVCDSSCVTCDGPGTTDCLTCKIHSFLALNNPLSNTGVCLSCDPTCSSCNGTSFDQCLTCYPGSYLVNNSRTCITKCDSPFFSTTNGTNVFCDTPCPGRFAFEDQNCTDSCESLHISQITASVLQACICNDYKYDNTSCIATCPFPLTNKTINNRKFCEFGCPKGQFLYFNGSCDDDCYPPFAPRIEGNYKFCDYIGCDGVILKHLKYTKTGHAYQMRFYSENCEVDPVNAEYTLNTDPTIKKYLGDSVFTVTKNKNKVFYIDLKLSQSLLEDIGINVMLIGLPGKLDVPTKLTPTLTAEKLTTIADSASSGVGFFTGSNIVTSLSLKSTASAWGFLGFQQFIVFFKYINIDYPLQLEFFFLLGGATDFGGAPNLLDKLTEKEYNLIQNIIQEDEELLEEISPPEKFMYYDTTSFFIKNGGSVFLFNWVALIAVLLLSSIKRIGNVKNNKIFQKIEDHLKWNFVIRSFLSSGLPLTISIFLQLRVLNSKEAYLTICSVLTILALAHYLSMCIFIFQILRKTNFESGNKTNLDKRYDTLFQGIDTKSNLAKYYHTFMFIRGIILALVVVFAEEVPLFQVLFLLFLNVGLVYYVFKIEFKERRETIKTRITETLIIVMEIFFAILTRKNMSNDYYQVIGWLNWSIIGIMFLNEIICVLISQYLAIRKVLPKIRDKIKSLKKQKNKISPESPDVTKDAKKPEQEEQVEFLEAVEGPSSPEASRNILSNSQTVAKEEKELEVISLSVQRMEEKPKALEAVEGPSSPEGSRNILSNSQTVAKEEKELEVISLSVQRME